MTLIDLFREFSHVATVENYPKSARLLYYTMLWYWNEQRRPDVARLPHAQLYTLAGLPEATYRIAFKYLADEGWIKRVKSRNRAISAWIMRDRCVKTAPPAGFLLSRAQSPSKEEGRIALAGDSSVPTEEAEQHVQPGSSGEIGDSGVNTRIRGVQGAAATPTEMDRRDVPDDLWD